MPGCNVRTGVGDVWCGTMLLSAERVLRGAWVGEVRGDGAAVAAPPAGVVGSVRVFISYAHESAEHVEAVRDLWVLLRSCGIDAQLDRVAAQQRQDCRCGWLIRSAPLITFW